jgi:hypothetical protein
MPWSMVKVVVTVKFFCFVLLDMFLILNQKMSIHVYKNLIKSSKKKAKGQDFDKICLPSGF